MLGALVTELQKKGTPNSLIAMKSYSFLLELSLFGSQNGQAYFGRKSDSVKECVAQRALRKVVCHFCSTNGSRAVLD